MAKIKRNVTDTVYDKLLMEIVQGNMKLGEKIPTENELKDKFGVSRNTIRTVLNRLNVLGVLDTRRGEGTFVRRISTEAHLDTFIPAILINSDNVKELMEFRKGIEVAAAGLAAVNATEEDLIKLEKCYELANREDSDNQEYALSTIDFHIQIAQASKNELFVKLLGLIKYILTSKMERFLYYQHDVKDSSFYHKMIFECIKARKPAEASYMTERHMTWLIEKVESYRKYIEENPENENSISKTKMEK